MNEDAKLATKADLEQLRQSVRTVAEGLARQAEMVARVLERPRWIEAGGYSLAIKHIQCINWSIDPKGSLSCVHIYTSTKALTLFGDDAIAFRSAWTAARPPRRQLRSTEEA